MRNYRNVNPNQEYINDWKELANGLILHRYGIIGTGTVGYDVYKRLIENGPNYFFVMYGSPFGPVGKISSVYAHTVEDMHYGAEKADKAGTIQARLQAYENKLIIENYPADFNTEGE